MGQAVLAEPMSLHGSGLGGRSRWAVGFSEEDRGMAA